MLALYLMRTVHMYWLCDSLQVASMVQVRQEAGAIKIRKDELQQDELVPSQRTGAFSPARKCPTHGKDKPCISRLSAPASLADCCLCVEHDGSRNYSQAGVQPCARNILQGGEQGHAVTRDGHVLCAGMRSPAPDPALPPSFDPEGRTRTATAFWNPTAAWIARCAAYLPAKSDTLGSGLPAVPSVFYMHLLYAT